MNWPPATIAAYALAGGFTRPQLAVAVAVALQGSNGDDGAVWGPQSGAGEQWAGLWQVPRSLIPLELWPGVFDPAKNAAMAVGLNRAHETAWEWSPVYRAGLWRQWIEVATVAAKRPSPSVSVATELIPRDVPGQAAETAGAVRDSVATVMGATSYIRGQLGG